MPKISVIVPVYNTEKFIHRCVDSILAQTFTDFELLLIDDGSKDNSGAICDAYATRDSRISVFHKENGGVSSARNLGLDNAKGEWVTFCDSDDYVYSSWLENYDIKNYATKYDLICQAIDTDKPICQGTERTSYGITFDGKICDSIDDLCKGHILGYLPIKALRLDIINRAKIRFDIRLKYKEDELFVLRYLQEGRNCICVNRTGYFYFVPDWNKYTSDYESERLVYENLFSEIKKIGLVESYYFQQIREALTYVHIREFIRNPRNRRNCIKELKRIIEIDYKASQIFFVTKFFIHFAPIFISEFVLLVHIRVKYGRHKDINNCTRL